VLQAARQRIVDDIARAVTILKDAAGDARMAVAPAKPAPKKAPARKAPARRKAKAKAKAKTKTVAKSRTRTGARRTSRR